MAVCRGGRRLVTERRPCRAPAGSIFDRGGFLMVDDFHNEREWDGFAAGIGAHYPGARSWN